jgi:hypothetical protein
VGMLVDACAYVCVCKKRCRSERRAGWGSTGSTFCAAGNLKTNYNFGRTENVVAKRRKELKRGNVALLRVRFAKYHVLSW